ncbi:MAG: SOS response-associated peptidase family protein [Asticcacaulis sp.]
MCNNYAQMMRGQAIADHVGADRIATNLEIEISGIFPNRYAPIVRNVPDGRELTAAMWGMPSPAFALKGKNSDPGVTNVRNTSSPHWRRWLSPEYRCLVPVTSFAEPHFQSKENTWFALNEDRPLMFFAGVYDHLTRKPLVKSDAIEGLFYGFLTTEPNAEVAPVHPKAMPVILTEDADLDMWLNAPWEEAQKLQRPYEDGALKIVARGKKTDGDTA